jgi:uncharacterized protein YggE
VLGLVLSCAAAQAQEAGSAPSGRGNTRGTHTTVRVEAEATETAAADRAVVTLGVRTEDPRPARAAGTSARTLEAVLSALRRELGEAAQIETSGYTLEPRYRAPQDTGEPELTGYVARNTVEVTLSELPQVGRAIDAALGAGANDVHGVAWTLRDDQPVRVRALRRAVERARAEAQAVAAELGMSLVRVVSVEEQAREGPRPLLARAAMDAAAIGATPVEPGTLDVRASVTLTAELAPR